MSFSRHPLLYAILSFYTCLCLTGCGSEARFKETTSLKNFQQQFSNTGREEIQGNRESLMKLPDSVYDGGDYLLGPGDLLVVKVLETDDLDTEVRVSSRGFINIPLLGNVKVMNLTAAEAEQLLEEEYKKEYFYDPHVSVYIKEHLSKQITLVGAIEKPGTYEYVTKRRLLDVLAMASGLTENAGPYAIITRKDPRTGKSSSFMVDLDDLIRNGNMANNHVVMGGDVIYLPESGKCFIDGAVRKPGTYQLSRNMTITEAIALAGGLASFADNDKIKLIRFMGRGKKRVVVNLSYNDLQQGLGDSLMLKDQDIIFAESSAAGKLFSGAGFTLGFMGTGVTLRDPEQYMH